MKQHWPVTKVLLLFLFIGISVFIVQKKTPQFRSKAASNSITLVGDQVMFAGETTPLKGMAALQTSDGYLDIAIIGDKFTTATMSRFLEDAQNYSTRFLKYVPFNKRSDQIRFHVVQNTQDLGCRRIPEVPRCIVCYQPGTTYGGMYDHIFSILKNQNVSYDSVAVIYNDPQYGGCAANGVAAISNQNTFASNNSNSSDVFVHELGHSIFGLADEYVSVAANSQSSSYAPNCFFGTPPNPDWNNLVPTSGYYNQVGCTYQNWYRPSESSIMKDLFGYFNGPSVNKINSTLDTFANPRDDTTPVSIEWKDPPAGSNIYFGSTIFSLQLSKPDLVSHLEVWLDGQYYMQVPTTYDLGPTISISTYRYSASTGTHTFQIKAVNLYNHVVGATDTRTLNVLNKAIPRCLYMNSSATSPFVGDTITITAKVENPIYPFNTLYISNGDNLMIERPIAAAIPAFVNYYMQIDTGNSLIPAQSRIWSFGNNLLVPSSSVSTYTWTINTSALYKPDANYNNSPLSNVWLTASTDIPGVPLSDDYKCTTNFKIQSAPPPTATPTLGPSSCFDSDGGNNPNYKGSCSSTYNGAASYSGEDSCLNSVYLEEWSCGKSVSEVNECYHTSVYCPAGCINGTCVNTQPPTPTLASTPTPPPPTIIGYLDVATCTTISGWSCNPTRPDDTAAISVYANGVFATSGAANVTRTDISSLCGGRANHGFSFNTPNSLKDGVTRTITASSLIAGVDKSLGSITLNCPRITPSPTPTPKVVPTLISTPTLTPASAPAPTCAKYSSPTGLRIARSQTGKVTFYWNTVAGAKGYLIYIADTVNGSPYRNICSPLLTGDYCTYPGLIPQAQTSFVRNLVPGHKYYWWMATVGECGNYPGTMRSFLNLIPTPIP